MKLKGEAKITIDNTKRIIVNANTGVNFYADTWQRRYVIQLDRINNVDFRISLNSEDICPSGFAHAGTEKCFLNNEVVELSPEEQVDLKEPLTRLIQIQDAAFYSQYTNVQLTFKY